MTLVERIKLGEGFSGKIYLDTNGNPTGGYGHHFAVGSLLDPEVWDLIFEFDLRVAAFEYNKLPTAVRAQVNQVRQEVLLEMIFNMGLPRLLGFKKMLAAVEAGDFETAAKEMLNSLWAKQVGKRADRLAELMRTGERENK